MSTEVAHDDPYVSYLAEAAQLDTRSVSAKQKSLTGLAAYTVMLIGIFFAISVNPWFVLISVLGIGVPFFLAIRVKRVRVAYHKLNKAYAPQLLIGDGVNTHDLRWLKSHNGSDVSVRIAGPRYYTNLQDQARSQGNGVWNVHAVAASNSLKSLQQWVRDAPHL